MAVITEEHAWPVRGLGYFLAHPRLWFAPLLATLAAGFAVGLVAVLVLWLTWPGAEVEGWWPNLWRGALAFVWFGLAGVVSWFAALPLLMGLAYEALSKRVLREHEVALGEERTISAMKSAAIVLLHNLGWMILWPCLAIACTIAALLVPLTSPLLVPLSVFLGQFGLAHIAVLEGADLALGARGVPGTKRWRMLRERRRAVLLAAVVGALMSLLLGLTLVGWVLFMPAMFTGAAIWVARWELSDEDQVVSAEAAAAPPTGLPPPADP